MKLEKQVVSLELARRLKEPLGASSTWVDVKGYKGLYQVNGCGFVRSLKRSNGYGSRRANRLLSLYLKKGYKVVALSKHRKTKYYTVHQLVARAFLKKPVGTVEVNHKDGNKLNCGWSNLEWCTKSYNQQHARRLGLQGGEHSNTAKLTIKQVRQIRRLYPKIKALALSKMFGIRESSIYKILKRQTWRYV